MRIGHGFDVHAFGGPGPIVIGGETIEYAQGLMAHSDGDVLIHAVCDALLGAAALGDIGHHFPDNDPAYANANSRYLLEQVIAALTGCGYRVVNIDSTIVAQAPKMAPHIASIRANIASDCKLAIDAVNVKATTTEKLGYTGRKEGIAAHAVTLIEKV